MATRKPFYKGNHYNIKYDIKKINAKSSTTFFVGKYIVQYYTVYYKNMVNTVWWSKNKAKSLLLHILFCDIAFCA